ncbi:beta strand repeat-containing protein, partial [Sediminibacterium soli]|uniref:beta strand repeat-containing protein n=1 Tax=Sediminibacterium soli TaxID=2698829 RepID=UPI001379EFA6
MIKLYRFHYLLFCCLCAAFSSTAVGQGVCSSSAAASVYKQDFGTSSKSNSKTTVPAGFTTNYSYINGTLDDGEYVVTPQVSNISSNSTLSDWGLGGDHTTGDVNGNMYIVNAGKPSSGPVDLFFSKQVDNLCPGSVFSFSAWLANMNTIQTKSSICVSNYTYAKVTFNIKNTSGTILATYTTDTLPLTKYRSTGSLNWNQYAFQFTLPAGTTSLVLEMRDALGGQASYCGNDFAVDDIEFTACTPSTVVSLSTASAICSGTATTFNSTLTNNPFVTPYYQWQKSTDGGTTWSNTGSASSTASDFPISSASTSDNGMYRVVVGPDASSVSSASSSCVSFSNSVTLTVNPTPTATISNNSPVCSSSTLTLTSTPSGGTSPYTYTWSGPNSFAATTQNASITNVTMAASGTYTYTITDSKGCSQTITANVTVNQTPVVNPITSSSGADGGCTGTSFTLSNTTTGGTWASSNTAVATVSSGGLVTMTGGGTALISYTVVNAGCSTSVTKSVSGTSVKLKQDVIECNNGVTHFSATDANYAVTYSTAGTGTAYSWVVTGGPFTYQGSSSASSQYPDFNLQSGYSYQVIANYTTNGITCSDTQMVYKNVLAADTISNSHDTTVCYNTSPVSLSGRASPVTNSFTWSTSGSGTFSSPNTLSTTYTLSAADKAAGSIKIYLTGTSSLQATGNCNGNVGKDSMILRIYPNNTGTNSTKSICSNQLVNYTPTSTIAGSSFSWSSALASGSITGNSPTGSGNITDSLINNSNSAAGSVLYTITPFAFTPESRTCPGTPFTLTVTVNPTPSVAISNNTPAVCTGSAINLQLSSSQTGVLYTWASSVVSGTATGNSSNATPTASNTITDVLTNTFNANTTVRYRVSVASSNGCSRTDSTDITIYSLATAANAGPDQLLCSGTNTVMAANVAGSGTGAWTAVAGNPSAVNFGTPSSPFSTVTGLQAGTYSLVWSITNGSCPVSRDTVQLINYAPTVGGTITGSTTVCASSNSGTLSLTGYTGNILRWEASTDGGTTWPTSISNTTNTYTYSNLAVTTSFRAVVQNGSCSIVYASPATITVTATTGAGILASDLTVCATSNSGTISITGYTGNILNWQFSTDAGGSWTNLAYTGNSYTFSNITATTMARVVIQSGNCAAVNSNAVTLTVNPATVPGTISANATVCAAANSGSLTLTGNTGTVSQWESSVDGGTTWSVIANTTSTQSYSNLTTTTYYRALVKSGSCNAQYTNTVIITVLQAVTPANAGPDQTLCAVTSATLAGNTPASGSGTWTFVSGPTTPVFTNANNPTTTVSAMTTGTYILRWTIANGSCATSSDDVQVVISPQTVTGTLAAPLTVCATANSGTLSLSGYTGSVSKWQTSIDNGNTWTDVVNTTNTISFSNLSVTTAYRAMVASGVCPAQGSNTVIVTVLQPVTPANAG